MQIPSSSPYLSLDEKRSLMQKNDWKAAWEIALHWTWIAVAFTIAWIWPHPLVILISLFILGGKQLACAILMHDAGHFAVLTNRQWNDRMGQWLGAWPIFQNMRSYRDYHIIHHKMTGLEEDPDIFLTRGYPTSRKSMMRKIFRDLTGITGVKAFAGLIMMQLGLLTYNLGNKVEWIPQKGRTFLETLRMAMANLSGPILANAVLFALLAVTLSPWVYLLWIGAYLTTFQFSLRIRSIAEHSVIDDPTDPIRNTRTTRANWLERMLFAPYHVNYHLEHHMLMTVPSYHLPKMHRLLVKRGFYEKGLLESGYWQVIRKAASV